jgi:hypothetical protein
MRRVHFALLFALLLAARLVFRHIFRHFAPLLFSAKKLKKSLKGSESTFLHLCFEIFLAPRGLRRQKSSRLPPQNRPRPIFLSSRLVMVSSKKKRKKNSVLTAPQSCPSFRGVPLLWERRRRDNAASSASALVFVGSRPLSVCHGSVCSLPALGMTWTRARESGCEAAPAVQGATNFLVSRLK